MTISDFKLGLLISEILRMQAVYPFEYDRPNGFARVNLANKAEGCNWTDCIQLEVTF